MHFSLTVVAAYAATAQAFKNTSPFLMFSNAEHTNSFAAAFKSQIQSAEDIINVAKNALSTCNSEIYYIISQPGLTATALPRSLPHLQAAELDETTKSVYNVAEVVGLKASHKDDLVRFVQQKCGAKVSNQFIDRARYGPRKVSTKETEIMVGSWTESEEKSGGSDPALQSNVLKDLALHHSYTFILLSTPDSKSVEAVEDPIYEAVFDDAVHMDLKRSLSAGKKNSTVESDQRPLFEKYQFLSPGLFMGLLVGFILLSILAVGLQAIASLKVSYGAFEKEMGPGSQKKAQ